MFLQFFYDLHPVAIVLYGLEIYWYGLAYVFGILLGLYYCNTIVNPNFNGQILVNYSIIGIVLGGRIGNIIFYDHSFSNIFNRAGMSFHGGLIGVALALLWISYHKKIPFFHLTDVVSVVSPIGLFFGRIANAINQEMLGSVTTSLTGVIYSQYDTQYRHPVSLYEAAGEGLFLLFLMHCIYKKHSNTHGITTSYFLIVYSLIRFICEYFKQAQYTYGMFTYGQYLSIIMCAIGMLILQKCQKLKS